MLSFLQRWGHSKSQKGGFTKAVDRKSAQDLFGCLIRHGLRRQFTFEIELVAEWKMRWPRPVCTEAAKRMPLTVHAGGFIDFSGWKRASLQHLNDAELADPKLRVWYGMISPHLQHPACTLDILELPLRGPNGGQAVSALDLSLWRQMFYAAAKQIEVHY